MANARLMAAPQLHAATVQRVLDPGGDTDSWKAIILVRSDARDSSVPCFLELTPAPALWDGGDLVIFGEVVPGRGQTLGRVRNAVIPDEARLAFAGRSGASAYTSVARRRAVDPSKAKASSPAALDPISASVLGAVIGAANAGTSLASIESANQIIAVRRPEQHPDPDIDWAMDRFREPGLAALRSGATLVMDQATLGNAAWEPGMTAAAYSESVTRKVTEAMPAIAGTRVRVVLGDLASREVNVSQPLDRNARSHEAKGVAIIAGAVGETSLAMLRGLARAQDGELTPRSTVRPGTLTRHLALHELAHAHEEGLGLERRKGDGHSARVSECFVEAASIMAMILNGEKPEEVERLVLAREAAAIFGAGAHVNGLAARVAFRTAVDYLNARPPGRPSAPVPMRAILRKAEVIARDTAIVHDEDLNVVAGIIRRKLPDWRSLTASKLSERIVVAVREAERGGQIKEPGKVRRTMEGAARSIRSAMLTPVDLADPTKADTYQKMAERDLRATVERLRNLGMLTGFSQRLREKEGEQALAIRRTGLLSVLDGYSIRGGRSGWLATKLLQLGSAESTLALRGKSKNNPWDERLSNFLDGRGFFGFLGKVAGSPWLSAAPIVEARRAATSLADRTAAASGRVLETASPATPSAAREDRSAIVALRPEGADARGDIWRMPVGGRVEACSRMVRELAIIARDAAANPELAEALQPRYSELLLARRDAIWS